MRRLIERMFSAPRRTGHTGKAALRLALITLFGAWLSIALSRVPGSLAAVWPLSALLLVTLMRRPRRDWPLLVLGYLGGASLGAVLAGNGWPAAVGLALLGAAEPAAAALLLLRSGIRRLDLTQPRALARFGLAILAAPLLSALPAGMLMWAIAGAPPVQGSATWYAAHVLGLAIVAPLAQVLLAERGSLSAWVRAAPVSLALLLALTVAVFTISSAQLFYLLVGPVLLVVRRLRGPGAALAVALVVSIALPLTALGLGPLAGGGVELPLAFRLQKLQLFLLFLSVLAQVFAAMLAQAERMQAVLRRQEEEGRRKTALLEAVLGAMEQGLGAFDAEGRLLVANRRNAEITGVPAALLTPGRHFLDLARWQAVRGAFGPGDPDALAQDRYAACTAGRTVEYVRTTVAGRTVQVCGRPLPDGGFVNTFSDITLQVEQARALAASEAEFRLMAEHSGDVVMRLGLDGRVVYASPAVQRVLQRPPADFLGRTLREFVQPEDASWAASALDPLVRGQAEETTTTYRILRPDESEVWMEERARLIRAPDGRPVEVVAVLRDATDRKAAEEELLATLEQMQAMAQTDGLTGLANRRRFDEMLLREWRRAARDGMPLSLLMVDVDRFKAFNDRYGHANGDECLRLLAVHLAAAARRPGDLAARHGGEEFALLLPGTDGPGALEVAERVRQAVMGCAVPHADNLPAGVVTASLGVATAWPEPEAECGKDRLLRQADHALYAAKSGGRNRVVPAPLACVA